MVIIDKNKSRLGKTRAEQARNLRRVYGGSGGLTDENLDRLRHVEKKLTERYGRAPGFIPQALLKKLTK